MDEPPKDRFCDLVMKGGITSGVVYPRAVALLAKHYRFNCIGGTSAGAIVAAVTAAAEFQRRHQNGSRAGFDLLGSIPDELAQPADGNGEHKRSSLSLGPDALVKPGKLLSLFQPRLGTHRLFRVLICSLNASTTGTRWISVVSGFVIAYWPALVFSVLAGVAIGYQLGSWLGAGLLSLALAVASVAAWIYNDLTNEVTNNGYGLCSGMTESNRFPGLTPWLHEQIQAAAGLSLDNPLTFGDLWEAPDAPQELSTLATPKGVRSIDLRMYATNLSHGRPYVFPLDEQKLA
ncbi:MAG: patatin-like phospholipase family protein, partial [Burkholderiaceae bacterium]